MKPAADQHCSQYPLIINNECNIVPQCYDSQACSGFPFSFKFPKALWGFRGHAFYSVGTVLLWGSVAYINCHRAPGGSAAILRSSSSCLSPRPSSVLVQAHALRWLSPSSSAIQVRVCTYLAGMVHPLGSHQWIPCRCTPNNPSVLPAPKTCLPVRKGLLDLSNPSLRLLPLPRSLGRRSSPL